MIHEIAKLTIIINLLVQSSLSNSYFQPCTKFKLHLFILFYSIYLFIYFWDIT